MSTTMQQARRLAGQGRAARAPQTPVRRPITVPATTPLRYVSFKHALNLRLPDEDTGGWHFDSAFFALSEDDTRAVPLAGQGPDTLADTTPQLGARGVRDMTEVAVAHGLFGAAEGRARGGFWVADHYRAITDLAMLHLADGEVPSIATPREINAWLDTEEQIETLRRDYLAPLGAALDGQAREAFEGWFQHVIWA